tara:strand:- start:2198 stop:3037 length:840 start_codon:yes stop_codon:yes gene_type:complete
MMEDMRIRGMGDKSQKAHIRALKDFTVFLKRSPDTATPDDLRAYQLHMADTRVTPSTFNARIVALRFFFSMTCGREEMKRYMQFRTEPRKLPIVLSVEEVSAVLAAAPGPGLKYRAALSIGYGGGLRASEVTHLKVRDIDSDRMLIHIERGKGGKDRDVMLSPSLLVLLRDYWREARPQGWLFPGQSRIDPISPRQLNRAFTSAKRPLIAASSDCQAMHGRDQKARNIAHVATQLCHASAGSEHRCACDPSVARAFQAEHNSAIYPCRDKDVGRYHQPV